MTAKVWYILYRNWVRGAANLYILPRDVNYLRPALTGSTTSNPSNSHHMELAASSAASDTNRESRESCALSGYLDATNTVKSKEIRFREIWNYKIVSYVCEEWNPINLSIPARLKFILFYFIYSFFNSQNIILWLQIYIESIIEKKCQMFLLSWTEPAGCLRDTIQRNLKLWDRIAKNEILWNSRFRWLELISTTSFQLSEYSRKAQYKTVEKFEIQHWPQNRILKHYII